MNYRDKILHDLTHCQVSIHMRGTISGLSLAQVAERLGMKSRNTYARYEQGRSVPSVEKLNELLNAVCPQRDIVIDESTIPLGSVIDQM